MSSASSVGSIDSVGNPTPLQTVGLAEMNAEVALALPSTQGTQQTETEEAETQSDRNLSEPERRKSFVWSHMQKTDDHVFCSLCRSKHKIPTDSAFCLQAKDGVFSLSTSTATLRRHLHNKHQVKENVTDNNRKEDKKQPARVYKRMTSEQEDALVAWIVFDDQPFRVVESPSFCTLLNKLGYAVRGRKYTTKLLHNSYQATREKVRDRCKSFDHVSLTMDMWTSVDNRAYIISTIHHVDDEFHSHNWVLDFSQLSHPHTGDNISRYLKEISAEYHLVGKITAITTDGGSNITKGVSLYAQYVDRIHKKKVHHIKCLAHQLNLVVKKGLEKMGDLVKDIRNLVVYVRSSAKRTEEFEDVRKAVFPDGSKKKLVLDVDTRWNSTFSMIERCVDLQVALDSFTEGSDHKINESDWQVAKELIKVLQPFKAATELISATRYPTIVLSRPVVLILLKKLLKRKKAVSKNETMEDAAMATIIEIIDGMVTKLLDFAKSLPDIAHAAMLMDPQWKDRGVEILGLPGVESIMSLQTSREKLRQIYESLQSSKESSDEEGPPAQKKARKKSYSFFDDFDNEDSNLSSVIEDPLSQYLNISKPAVLPGTMLDLKKWWRDYSESSPDLFELARFILHIPATSVPAERGFSSAGMVLNQYRTRMSNESLRAAICLKSWFAEMGAGFPPQGDSDDED